jgi:hypothetical protein
MSSTNQFSLYVNYDFLLYFSHKQPANGYFVAVHRQATFLVLLFILGVTTGISHPKKHDLTDTLSEILEGWGT